MIGIRLLVAAAAVAALAPAARAGGEAGAIAAGGEPDAEARWSAGAGVGAGFEGNATVSALDARFDLAWGGGALGVGARLRVVGDRFATADWDELGDWLALVRYLVLRNDAARDAARLEGDGAAPAGRWRFELAGGALGDLRVGAGTIVDGFTAAALADRRAAGAHVRVGRGDALGEVVVADLARGTLLAAAAEAPARRVRLGGALALDPAAPVGLAMTAPDARVDSRPLAALAASAAIVAERPGARARLAVEIGWQPGLGAGAAAVASGAARAADRVVVRGRAELGAGTAGWIAAPFGPLYLRVRDDAGGGASLVDRARAGELGGVGAAAELAVDADDLGGAAASARHRPGLGTELTARLAAPALAGVQGAVRAAWIPAMDDALLVGAEAHGELGRGLWTAVEAARRYRAGDGDPAGLHATRPVWHVIAWFGVTR